MINAIQGALSPTDAALIVSALVGLLVIVIGTLGLLVKLAGDLIGARRKIVQAEGEAKAAHVRATEAAEDVRRETVLKLSEARADMERLTTQSQLENQRVIREQFNTLGAQLQDAVKERGQLSERLDTLRDATASRDADNAHTVGQLEGTIKTLTSQLGDLTQNYAAMRNVVADLQAKVQSLTEALNLKTDEAAQTQSRLTDTEQRLTDTERQLTDTKQQLTEANTDKGRMQRQMDTMQDNLHTMQGNLDTERGKVEQLTKELEKLKNTLPATDKLTITQTTVNETEKDKSK